MASLVKSILTRTSAGPDQTSQGTPKAFTPSSARSSATTTGLSSSPSFNDLSFGAGGDAEHEFTRMASEPVPSRYSTDSARTSFEGRDDGEGSLLSSSPSWRLARSLSGWGAARQVPHKDGLSGLDHQGAPVTPRTPGKIHGFDYYDYCEVIRSNSL